MRSVRLSRSTRRGVRSLGGGSGTLWVVNMAMAVVATCRSGLHDTFFAGKRFMDQRCGKEDCALEVANIRPYSSLTRKDVSL